MAPEMWAQPKPKKDPNQRHKTFIRASAMVDSWSLGIVFLHCLNGELPDLDTIKQKVATVKDDKLRTILEALLNEDPLNRKYLHEIYQDVTNVSRYEYN